MLDSDIKVHLNHFDGPLGLLLHLLQKEEMSIREIEIKSITEQYLEFLDQMNELDFDLAGDYLFMAATLVLLKSHSCIEEDDIQKLLGDEGEQGTPILSRAELIQRLEELQHFQDMGAKLWALPKKGHETFIRPKIDKKSIINSFNEPMLSDDLVAAYMDIIRRERKKYKVVKRDRLSIKEKLNFLKEFLRIGTKTTLSEILEKDKISTEKVTLRTNTVITFISLLELARLKRIKVFQNETYGPLYVDVIKDLRDFDVQSADGFDEEEAEGLEGDEDLESDSFVSTDQANPEDKKVIMTEPPTDIIQ